MSEKPYACDFCGGNYGELEFCCKRRLEYIAWSLPDIHEMQRRYDIVKSAFKHIHFEVKEATTQLNARSMAIERLEFSVRTNNLLRDLNIHTVGQLAECSEQQLKTLKGMGRRSIVEIKEGLAQAGLVLRN